MMANEFTMSAQNLRSGLPESGSIKREEPQYGLSDEDLKALEVEYGLSDADLEALEKEYGLGGKEGSGQMVMGEGEFKEPSPEDYKGQTSPFGALVSGAASGLTAGFSPRIGAGLRSIVSDKPYEYLLKEQKAYQQAQKQAHPGWYGASQFGGSIGLGGKFGGYKGAAGLGGAAAVGESDIDIAKDPAGAAKTFAGGATIGLGAQYGLDKFAKALKALGGMGKLASERAVKAATGGGQLDIIRKASRRPGGIQRTGEHLLQKGPQGEPPVIGWGTKHTDASEAVLNRLDEYGSQIEQIANISDDIAKKIPDFPNEPINAKMIADDLLEEANKLPDIQEAEGLREKMLNLAQQLEVKGNISFKEAQKLKEFFDFRKPQPLTSELGEPVSNKIYRTISNGMEKSIDDLSKHPAIDDEARGLLSNYKDIKQQYQTYRIMGEGVIKGEEKELSRRFASPSDYGVGIGLGAGGLASGQLEPEEAALLGLGTGAANKLIRERGSAFVARMAKLLETSPEFRQKYGSWLMQSLQTNAPSLGVIHQVLSNQDPEYRKYFESEQDFQGKYGSPSPIPPYAPQGEEMGLEEEGVFDVLKPMKYAAGVEPGGVVDMLTPDAPPIPGLSGAGLLGVGKMKKYRRAKKMKKDIDKYSDDELKYFGYELKEKLEKKNDELKELKDRFSGKHGTVYIHEWPIEDQNKIRDLRDEVEDVWSALDDLKGIRGEGGGLIRPSLKDDFESGEMFRKNRDISNVSPRVRRQLNEDAEYDSEKYKRLWEQIHGEDFPTKGYKPPKRVKAEEQARWRKQYKEDLAAQSKRIKDIIEHEKSNPGYIDTIIKKMQDRFDELRFYKETGESNIDEALYDRIRRQLAEYKKAKADLEFDAPVSTKGYDEMLLEPERIKDPQGYMQGLSEEFQRAMKKAKDEEEKERLMKAYKRLMQ